MTHSKVEAALAAYAAHIEARLSDLIPATEGPHARVVEAMRYACLGGGKRLRPFLVACSADLFGVPRAQSDRVGAALEMIHSYSLAHDDLPAMDDSDLRRGRPSVHAAFDDATAILAGDGLLTLAFEIIGEASTHESGEVRAQLAVELAQAAGMAGMVGGQMVDLAAERDGLALDLDGITLLQRMKTGALIRFACMAGATLGRAAPDARARLVGYAEDVGLAFQIVDDLLDAFGDAAALGKPVGQDTAMDKATFVKLLGPDGARARAHELVAQAVARLEPFGPEAEPLRDVARFVVARTH